jgi:non-ribosomal peptide synthetase component F
MGYFVNPVVLKSCFNEGLTFSELLNQVRRTVLSAYEHQGYPFASLVEKIQAERDPGRSPVFQAMFVLQKSTCLRRRLTSFVLEKP